MGSKRNVRKRFVGVDGEGTTIGDEHFYNLLRAGSQTLENADGSPLSWWQCLNFLSSLPPENEYVSYFFDYDVTMILRGCREERIRRLLDREARTTEGFSGPLPVDIDEFTIEYLPKKEFRVKRHGGHWVRISDTGTFFQSAFVTTLEKWKVVDDWTLAKIMMGKEKRSIVTQIDEEVREYNGLEIQALEGLMERFRDVCETIGYVPRLWQGPGNLATAMFRKHRIPKAETLTDIPDEVWRWAQAAYYGGRFETTAVGDVKGPVYQYDINSAYPWAITQLPCLVHAQWEKVNTRPTDKFWVAYMGFGHGTTRQLCHLPIRLDDGSIRYPQKGRGWYWSVEVLAAEQAGTTTYCDSGYWTLKQTCLCTPFDWVRTLYVMRVALGKSDKGMVLKLALNSLYGKTAQSIGSAPYGNPIWASLITALTRAALITAYSQAPESCYMLATDGLFMGQKLDLPINTHLGGWEETEHADGMFIIQPGLYFVSGAQYPKTRGIPMRKVLERESEFRLVWSERSGDIPSVTIPMRNFIGLRLAIARNRYETAGQWLGNEKVVSFDWSTKRRPHSVIQDAIGIRTLPYAGKSTLVTLPYTKLIGGNIVKDYERLLMEDQPDWSDVL